MKFALGDLYARIFARPVFEPWNRALLWFGLRGLGVLNWRSDSLSGETDFACSVLRKMDRADAVVVDVGANEGEFIADVLSASTHARVLGFEPHPRTYGRLHQRFAAKHRVTMVNCALGEREASLSLFDKARSDGSQHASMYRDVIEEIHGSGATEFNVQVRSLDDVLEQLNLTANVVLLKIDVEGYEAEVLKGARRLIESKNLKVVIVEFNEMNVKSRTFVLDLEKSLGGFKAFRILPGGKLLSLSPYSAWRTEIFAYQNLAFVRD
jgi:FkbM family methyltransferase